VAAIRLHGEAMDYAEEDASELVLRHTFDAFDRLGDKLWSEELVKDLILQHLQQQEKGPGT
jgi:hypothetical protein